MRVKFLYSTFIIVLWLFSSCSEMEKNETSEVFTEIEARLIELETRIESLEVMQREIELTEDILEKASLDWFMVDTESFEDTQITIYFENLTRRVSNILHQGTSLDGNQYFFLATKNEEKQILVVLNDGLQKLQWGDYYPKYSYFDPEQLVAFVTEPFPERHQSAVIKVYDFMIDHFITKEMDLSFSLGSNEGDKQAYYQTPAFEKLQRDENSPIGYNLYWIQANFSFRDDSYSLQEEFRGGIYRSSDESSFEELEILEDIGYSRRGASYEDYEIFARNVNDSSVVDFLVPTGENLSWGNCKISFYSKETPNKTLQIPFKDIFKYQDPLLSITSATGGVTVSEKLDVTLGYPPIEKTYELKGRIPFIVETSEFSYDVYIDPKAQTADIFLRPSSFVRLYPR